MANNPNEAPADKRWSISSAPPHFVATEIGLALSDGSGLSSTAATSMMLQLGSSLWPHIRSRRRGRSGRRGIPRGPVFPLGLSLELRKGGFIKPEGAPRSGERFPEEVVDRT
ncbi:uncharacterized protein LOC115680934 [Syzygium oleosum]|uniref:uncharacterized protein LOC115680934 n=1 Tax=Syzygium oleosum TaxID=219896 RepID=UPI0011D1FF40|nr:uncharacterized protein LOC115680934 [Syzygium oleosum]